MGEKKLELIINGYIGFKMEKKTEKIINKINEKKTNVSTNQLQKNGLTLFV
jgi:hypothetical protein